MRFHFYSREVGQGRAIIVLHGGPDFDHSYLLPDLDRLSDSFHLIYYDQRGRGKSADGVEATDVSLQTEIADLDQVRQRFQLVSPAILGHSWGAVLALEYAVQYPERVSHLILMNPAPVSRDDYLLFRKRYVERLADGLVRLKAVAASEAYKDADPDTVADYYRIHFSAALARPEDVDRVVSSLRRSFSKEGIRLARQIEARLMAETWWSTGYDLLPRLTSLRIPSLVLCGIHDFFPLAVGDHIARAIPDSRLVVLKDAGHFAYLECPAAVLRHIQDFVG